MLEESDRGGNHHCSYICAGDTKMRRDDVLIRKLMLGFEATDDFLLYCVRSPGLDGGSSNDRVYYHLKCLADSGFLEEVSPSNGIFRMTNSGHDFCAAVRDDTTWRKIQDASGKVAGVPLSIMKEVGLGYLRAKLGQMGVLIA